ncbi:short-chain dehydrogenase [Lujinxingia litoralis]|uniref:Short-chain dehydrogenase n=1 Tax=Lujinxingia litoralis TaxID=2211119 RepID=A0A328CC58_9DELT|nr:SDR family oxidoreductase [Lujinxingia litoralis]RAL24741.1 short-chain dehydrogenase [Lujinxingia litoralis]
MQLNDMKVIVTGAAQGMGRTFTLELLKSGADVMAVDLASDALATLLADASGLSGRLATFAADVSDEHAVKAAVAATVEAFGKVNGVINNAGIFRDRLLVKKDRKSGQVQTMSLQDWQAVLDVDLTGPFLFTREVAAWMVENDEKGGVIVNISSISRHGNQGQSNYSAAKAGLIADTKLWGEELARYGIRVGAVAPGFVETPILAGMREDMLQAMVNRVPLRRVGKPEEIFMAVRFIIECDYFTGRCIDVDGGVSI